MGWNSSTAAISAELHCIIQVTITLEGDANGAPHPDVSAYAKKFLEIHASTN